MLMLGCRGQRLKVSREVHAHLALIQLFYLLFESRGTPLILIFPYHKCTLRALQAGKELTLVLRLPQCRHPILLFQELSNLQAEVRIPFRFDMSHKVLIVFFHGPCALNTRFALD